MGHKRVQLSKTRTTKRSTTTDNRHSNPATDRSEIRKDVAKVWWPDA